MSWLLVGAAAGGWTVAVVVGVVLSLRASRRETRMALQVRAHVEPYLRRRATELQLDALASDPGAAPDAIVAGICALADQLTAREKADVSLGDTQDLAVSETMPSGPVPPVPRG